MDKTKKTETNSQNNLQKTEKPLENKNSLLEIIVKAIAVLYLGGAFSIFVVSFTIFLGWLMNREAPSSLLLISMVIILFIVAVLYTFVGLGLWKHRNWARILTIVISVIGFITFPPLNFLIIYFLGFNKEVKQLFKRTN